MNVTPISATNNITPVQTNSNLDLLISNSTTNVPNNAQWLSQEAFMLDVINTFQSFGFNFDNLEVNNTTNTNPLLSTNINLNEALNNFVLSVQASLNQASTANHTGANNQEGTTSADQSQGFNNFANDLQLLSLLNNTNSNSSLIGDTSINSNPLLQSNFNNLLNILAPLSPAVTTPPTLNDFFNMMLKNLETQINNQNNVGTSFSTTV